MFDISQLRCFVAVAEELHFGRAAQRLNMTQPPLSRQVQLLEHIIQATLLERTSRSVRLTAAGRSFLPEAKRILKLAESAAEVARRISQGKIGSIKIGYTAVTAYSFLPRLVTACRVRMPEIDLSLKEMVSGEQIEALSTGQIDVALLRPPVQRPEFESAKVASESLLAAIPENNELARQRVIDLAVFDKQPFIMYSPHESRYFHDLLVSQFSRAQILPRYVQHLGQIHSIMALVRAGLGCGIVPESAASLHFEGVVLKPLKLAEPTDVELFVVWRRDTDHPLVPALVDIAKSLKDA